MGNIKNWHNINLTTLFDSKSRCFEIVTIIVTFNRKELLLNCIDLLLKQSEGTDVLVVDNASTDDTKNILIDSGFVDDERVHYIRLDENTGGAGGFYYGLKYALGKGWSWFWLMDDDAEPDRNALETLVHEVQGDSTSIYGSIAVGLEGDGDKLCFPIKVCTGEGTIVVEDYGSLSTKETVSWLPFLGFFIHKDTISKIGLPDRELFIRNDDVEYSERAKKVGIKIYMIKQSIIKHPYQPTVSFNLLGMKIFYRSMPPWKMYYEVRNKIIIAKKYYSFTTGIKSVAGVFLQVLISVVLENKRFQYIKSFFKGCYDGVLTVVSS